MKAWLALGIVAIAGVVGYRLADPMLDAAASDICEAYASSQGWEEAHLPNECWQADVTHWLLADGSEVEITNTFDDYSRLCVASRVHRTTTAKAVVQVFTRAANCSSRRRVPIQSGARPRT